VATSEWTCERCGETFDAKVTSALQHRCFIAEQSIEFDRALTIYLSKPVGQFAMYYAQRLINASLGSNNTLVV
jgi:hypothetical protein